jgi:pimeloyl-ACP methyl ester carboxylesterase
MDGFSHTDDDNSLRYTERGAGRPVVFVHGWQGAAEQWRSAAQSLAGECRTVTYDQRGHGRSHDAPSGWTVRLVLVDQAPAMLVDRVWNEWTIGRTGAIFTDRELHAPCHSLADPESREQAVRTIVGGMLTPAAPRGLKDRVVAWGMRVDGSFAAALLRNHAHHDWRRQIGLVELPTLVVAGRASVVPWSAAEWIARKIPGARLEIFEPDEGGSHLLALENPAKFNRLLREFVAGVPSSADSRLPLPDPTPSIEPEGATT